MATARPRQARTVTDVGAFRTGKVAGPLKGSIDLSRLVKLGRRQRPAGQHFREHREFAWLTLSIVRALIRGFVGHAIAIALDMSGSYRQIDIDRCQIDGRYLWRSSLRTAVSFYISVNARQLFSCAHIVLRQARCSALCPMPAKTLVVAQRRSTWHLLIRSVVAM